MARDLSATFAEEHTDPGLCIGIPGMIAGLLTCHLLCTIQKEMNFNCELLSRPSGLYLCFNPDPRSFS